MRIVGDLQKYTQFQTADSISIAAANQNGAAGAGVAIGAGAVLGQSMMQNMTQNSVNVAQEDPIKMLEKLGELHAKGILTQQEFDAKKAELLSKIK